MGNQTFRKPSAFGSRIREERERATDKRLGPMFCAAPGCPNHGTISESTHHSSVDDTRWYCRAHWAARGSIVESGLVTDEIARGLHSVDRRHWADAAVDDAILSGSAVARDAAARVTGDLRRASERPSRADPLRAASLRRADAESEDLSMRKAFYAARDLQNLTVDAGRGDGGAIADDGIPW